MTRYTILSSAMSLVLLTPVVAFAQLTDGSPGDFGTAISGFTNLINSYLIPLLIAFAVLAFIYGVFQYFIAGGADEEKRAAGRSLMLYALLGFVAIVALWGIVNFLIDAFGFTDRTVSDGPEPIGVNPQ